MSFAHQSHIIHSKTFWLLALLLVAAVLVVQNLPKPAPETLKTQVTQTLPNPNTTQRAEETTYDLQHQILQSVLLNLNP